jgi:hypothetical protein
MSNFIPESLDVEKMVGDRVNTLLTDPQLFEVYQKFGGAIFRRSSIYHGLAAFLRENNVRGRTCFEVGSWNGLTALVLARHFDMVVSVDIAHNHVKRQIAEEMGVRNIEFVDIMDNDHKANVAKGLQFDFAYLDGDHAHDTQSDWLLTNRCGRVLFHEVWPFQLPVWNLVASLPANEVTRGGIGLAMWEGPKRG